MEHLEDYFRKLTETMETMAKIVVYMAGLYQGEKASRRETRDKPRMREIQNEQGEQSRKRTANVYEFTEEEIENMPNHIKDIFKDKNGPHMRILKNGCIEFRLQVNGRRISAAGKTMERAKANFLYKLQTYIIEQLKGSKPESAGKSTMKAVSDPEPVPTGPTFRAYAARWLEEVKKPEVKTVTYNSYKRNFKVYLYPVLGAQRMNSISAFSLQKLFNRLYEKENFRTAEILHKLLSALFSFAQSDGAISRDPMLKIKVRHYDRREGLPLTREEEAYLVRNLDKPLAAAYLFLTYTGLRRSELASVTVENGWIHCISAKTRQGYREKERQIPVSPMLQKVIDRIPVEKIRAYSADTLTRKVKNFLPDHCVHDLRHTFITRCMECNIQKELISLWVGHIDSSTMTTRVYTHMQHNRQHQIEEMQKFSYDLP